MKLPLCIAATSVAAFLLVSTAFASEVPCTSAEDSVAFSFVVLGCNRVDRADTNTEVNPSTANLAQLDRTFEEVQQLSPKPTFLFMAGDLVMGYQADTNKLAAELMAWRKHYEQSTIAKSGITLVAIPGNHETQNAERTAIAPSEQQWLKVMAPYIRGNNGPGVGGADNLKTDQSRLTYSFDYTDTHFITLNTDPVGQDAHLPVKWIAKDLARAHAAGAKHIFAIGHKPAYAYNGKISDGLVEDNRNEFWSALEGAHGEAMLSAHNHIYTRIQPRGKTWMIIAGNGGSLLEKGAATDQQFYGYTLISIMKNGTVQAKSYGRRIPEEGYFAAAPATTYPTTVRDSLDITWKY